MDLTLARLVTALRNADVAVSPAETLDALHVVRKVGLDDPMVLKNALALVLAKNPREKALFDGCFDAFFHQFAFQRPAKSSMLGTFDSERLLARVEPLATPDLLQVLRSILSGQDGWLAWQVQQRAGALELGAMQTLRDKGHRADRLERMLGADELERLQTHPALAGEPALLDGLRYVRRYIGEEVRAYVDQQYRLRVDATGRRSIVDAALRSNLDQLPPGYHEEADRVVRKLAAGLAQNHRRRRRRAARGALELKRTLRRNMAFDGTLFHLHWRQKRLERSTVFVVCDLSSSVSSIARFLLTFLYELSDVLPSVRTFAFSNRCGEISDLFDRHDAARAVEEALFAWGRGTTDYGQALFDFREQAGRDLDRHSVVIFLGDARGNYYEPRVDVMRAIAQRARQVFWLTPESPERWGEGDSLMRHYLPFCLRVDTCARLPDIERFADRLLTVTR